MVTACGRGRTGQPVPGRVQTSGEPRAERKRRGVSLQLYVVRNASLQFTRSITRRLKPSAGEKVAGSLRSGQIGVIVEDDRSSIPFKVRAPNGETSWYREDVLHHIVDYSAEDVVNQQR